MPDFSFLILTFNEAMHLTRLLESIKKLNAPVFIVDSGSTDETLKIAAEYNCQVFQNPFVNHPTQWDFALTTCPVITPWIIGLDADQYLSPILFARLSSFSDKAIDPELNGIYFNRHNYFHGKRMMYGGYRNFYMLKMFRKGKGHSDLNENMDHRFVVEGKKTVWKDGVINEHNLKEDNIDFWIEKHIRYSTLVAQEEWERIKGSRLQAQRGRLLGTPDEKKAIFKRIWWKMPLFIRPFIYFFYRFVLLGGFLESSEGRMFHFLQSLWFRLVVDFKIMKLKMNNV